MLGAWYHHEGGRILKDAGDCASWGKKKREMETQKERRKVRRRETERKLFLTGYLYMHLWGAILASNILY